jgi:NOL1/NOP2/sun family putative RNA methylase
VSLTDLEPYRELIDDWNAFTEAVARPEPTTLRVNRLRTSVDAVREALHAEGFGVEELSGQPGMLRVLDGPRSVSDTWGHWAGHFYIQQASTALAVQLLAPRPGEKILDMCAAPGGKTTHLAEAMEGRGEIVATEVNDGRIRALLGNIYRLGLPNILVVRADGRTLPDEALFHRVLVDVPCSAQGTIRKKGGRVPSRSRRFMKQVTRAQEKLLRRAIDVTAPGGVVLYVTCTFGPEENEAVVSRVLADAPVSVEALDPPVPHAPGVTSFGEVSYDPRLAGAVRIYPHHLDSGGLFICRLRKEGTPVEDALPGPLTGWAPVPEAWDDDDPSAAAPAHRPERSVVRRTLSLLDEHYGVDATHFRGMRWLERGSNLWLHGLREWPLDAWSAGKHWRMVAMGLRAVDTGGDGPPRPTNDLLQWLDGAITRSRLELDRAGWRDLLDGREVRVPDVERGHLALCLDGHVVGWGFVRAHRLQHHVPRGRSKWLRNVVVPRAPHPAEATDPD